MGHDPWLAGGYCVCLLSDRNYDPRYCCVQLSQLCPPALARDIDHDWVWCPGRLGQHLWEEIFAFVGDLGWNSARVGFQFPCVACALLIHELGPQAFLLHRHNFSASDQYEGIQCVCMEDLHKRRWLAERWGQLLPWLPYASFCPSRR